MSSVNTCGSKLIPNQKRKLTGIINHSSTLVFILQDLGFTVGEQLNHFGALKPLIKASIVGANNSGNSLMVQWLGLGIFTANGLGSVSSQGTKIP